VIRVGINGYGTIGKRVADAVSLQPDMTVAGVSKRTPDYEATVARRRGFDLYPPDADRRAAFGEAGFPASGTTGDLVAESDVIVDATPAGVGATYRSQYAEYGTPAVFQGGEDADVADASFNARASFRSAGGADAVRVVSCNTTGLCRLLAPIEEAYGVESARVTLVRRGGDPTQSDRGPIDDILPDPVTTPSHHGPDVRTVLPDLDVHTFGVTVPATLMHLHAVNVTVEDPVTAGDVRSLLRAESRVALIPGGFGADSCGRLRDLARDSGRPRGDIWENCVWEESVSVEERELFLFQAINQESDVVPENVDAVRAILETAGPAESRRKTNDALGVGLLEGERRPRVAGEPTPG